MITYRHALVLGLGRSGIAAARLFLHERTRVTALERNGDVLKTTAVRELRAAGVTVNLGDDLPAADEYDVCIVSPGFALTSPPVSAARKRGIPLLSELELGWSRLRCPTLAITGSNGKSTAVKWCAESFVHAGLSSLPAGNYGLPVSNVALNRPDLDRLVVEVSSFQLETVQAFSPDVAVVLNLLPNHFDRHGDMDRYVATKARMLSAARPETVCLVPWAWAERLRSESGGAGDWQTFGTEPTATWRTDQGHVFHDGAVVADLAGSLFGQDVMGPAAAAVIGALAASGVAARHAEETARVFEPLPYRVQEIARVGGVRYVNDAKSTNWAATAHALESISGPIRLIAGGLAKDKDFESLKERLSERVATVYLMGNAAEAMASAWSCIVPCVMSGTLSQAIREAKKDAREGETILFSPGCASFDQFRNYEERGEQFTGLVHDLVGEGPL